MGDSSMMIVALVGGVACCAFVSCISSIGYWYSIDNCMGGLLAPCSTQSPSTTTKPSTTSTTSTTTSVPRNKPLWIRYESPGCPNTSARFLGYNWGNGHGGREKCDLSGGLASVTMVPYGTSKSTVFMKVSDKDLYYTANDAGNGFNVSAEAKKTDATQLPRQLWLTSTKKNGKFTLRSKYFSTQSGKSSYLGVPGGSCDSSTGLIGLTSIPVNDGWRWASTAPDPKVCAL